MQFDIIFELDNNIYCKEAVIATVYDWVDDYAMLLETTDATFVVKVVDKDNTFDKERFIKDLNVNEMREIVNQRTGNMRDALFMATVARGI